MSFRWSETKVLDAVLTLQYPEPWLTMRQFRPGAGTGQWAEKAFDAFCFHPWTSEAYARHVIEAKISRSDFLKEMKDPLKRRAGLYCATKFWYAAPPGCVRFLDEIPINCGYYEVTVNEDETYNIEIKVPAPELADEPPTWNFLAAAARQVLRLEQVEDLASLEQIHIELQKVRTERDDARAKLLESQIKLEKLRKVVQSLR